MDPDSGFKVCRACLTPETDVHFSSLFEGTGEYAKIFQLVANVDVSFGKFLNNIPLTRSIG